MSRAVPILALDYSEPADALAIVKLLGTSCDYYKIGSELFTVAGPEIVRRLVGEGNRVFLDLKFHDIPHTVEQACHAASALGVSMVTVHASGGSRMVRHAATAFERGGARVIAVTVLTSLSAAELAETRGQSDGAHAGAELAVAAGVLAALAFGSGADGIVCSGLEVAELRARFGPDRDYVVPGVRLAGTPTADQRRTVSPGQAAAAGATHLVLGRTVTATPDPLRAWSEAVASIG